MDQPNVVNQTWSTKHGQPSTVSPVRIKK